jgi:cation diffusion facilitator CzcD-associated flavoprotein CzcO
LNIGVIGTGASAIQLVPAIVDEVAALAVFQRTPPWVVPKADRPFDAAERWRFRRLPPYRWYVRERLYWIHERRAAGFVSDPRLQAATAAFAQKLLRRQVRDPVLRARLTPDYDIGCKRLLVSSDWYPALTRSHVDVHGAAARVVSKGVLAEDGESAQADVLVFATGFDAHDNVTRVPIFGRDGVSLAQSWADGAQAYLGTTVTGFPNLFVLAGPNTGLGHNSQLFMIEAQIRYVVRCLRRMRRRAGSLEVRPEAQGAFVDWVRQRMGATVWQSGRCHSWYQHPRTGRNTVLWPDTTIALAPHAPRPDGGLRRASLSPLSSYRAAGTPSRCTGRRARRG